MFEFQVEFSDKLGSQAGNTLTGFSINTTMLSITTPLPSSLNSSPTHLYSPYLPIKSFFHSTSAGTQLFQFTFTIFFFFFLSNAFETLLFQLKPPFLTLGDFNYYYPRSLLRTLSQTLTLSLIQNVRLTLTCAPKPFHNLGFLFAPLPFA